MIVICIDDSHKPEDIKSSDWVVKDREYTVINTIKCNMTGDYAFQLSEISPNNPLYAGYNVNRFKIGDNIIEPELLNKEYAS
jgi:hypothetical protein